MKKISAILGLLIIVSIIIGSLGVISAEDFEEITVDNISFNIPTEYLEYDISGENYTGNVEFEKGNGQMISIIVTNLSDKGILEDKAFENILTNFNSSTDMEEKTIHGKNGYLANDVDLNNTDGSTVTFFLYREENNAILIGAPNETVVDAIIV